MRFLIDECLSIDLIPIASEAGHEAQHVARIGKAGWKDWNVVRTAADGDFVLVTNNASDFRKLYATTPMHAGLIIIVPNVDRTLQKVLFRAALEAIFTPNDLVNRVLEVGIDGEDVTLDLYDLPLHPSAQRTNFDDKLESGRMARSHAESPSTTPHSGFDSWRAGRAGPAARLSAGHRDAAQMDGPRAAAGFPAG